MNKEGRFRSYGFGWSGGHLFEIYKFEINKFEIRKIRNKIYEIIYSMPYHS